MYTVYILLSTTKFRHYIGSTADLTQRLRRHNSGKVRSTKKHVPWIVIYTESHPTRSSAYQRELEIKSYNGGAAFKKLLGK